MQVDIPYMDPNRILYILLQANPYIPYLIIPYHTVSRIRDAYKKPTSHVEAHDQGARIDQGMIARPENIRFLWWWWVVVGGGGWWW